VRRQDNSGTLGDCILDSWQARSEPGIIGNPALIILRNVEINPDKYPFAFESEILDGQFAH
jgi:hypothetical protein